jgi:hypothetical protein
MQFDSGSSQQQDAVKVAQLTDWIVRALDKRNDDLLVKIAALRSAADVFANVASAATLAAAISKALGGAS